MCAKGNSIKGMARASLLRVRQNMYQEECLKATPDHAKQQHALVTTPQHSNTAKNVNEQEQAHQHRKPNQPSRTNRQVRTKTKYNKKMK